MNLWRFPIGPGRIRTSPRRSSLTLPMKKTRIWRVVSLRKRLAGRFFYDLETRGLCVSGSGTIVRSPGFQI